MSGWVRALARIWPRALAGSARGATEREAGHDGPDEREAPSALPPSAPERAEFDGRLASLAEAPLLSLVVALGDASPRDLAATLGSVIEQPYDAWELIVVGDGEGLAAAGEAAIGENRIRTAATGPSGGASAELNAGVAEAGGAFVVLLPVGHTLSADALLSFAEAMAEHPETDAWYADLAELDGAGASGVERPKPAWSPLFLLGSMYVGGVLAVRTTLCRELPFRPEFDGIERHEFLLRLSERSGAVGRIPRVLSRGRAVPDGLGTARREELQEGAARAHLARRGRTWRVRPGGRHPGRLLIKAGPATRCPKVSIVIPTRDQGVVVARCLRSIFALTDYPDFEVVVVDNRTVDRVARAAFAGLPIVHVPYDEPRFNYSAANNLGVARSDGELIVFLNNDTEVMDPDWLRDLALFFEDPTIGAVGPVLLYPNGAVQHAGVVLGARGTADHVMRHVPGDADGEAGALVVAREVSAVTAACLMMPRRLFDELGGFSTDYATHYQDVDLCLKIGRTGRRIVCAGFPRLLHHESLSRGADGYDHGDRALLLDTWWDEIAAGDPYYHPRLSLARLDYTLAP